MPIAKTDSTNSLPSSKSEVSESMLDYTWLFHGERKIGKTQVASMFETPLFVATEPGHRAISVFKTPVIDSWPQYKKVLKEFANGKRFKTAIIDTVLPVYNLCMDAILEEMDIEKTAEAEWGESWNRIRKEFEETHNKVLASGKGIVFIAHSEIVTFKKKGGAEVVKYRLDLSKQARRYITGLIDNIVYFHYDDDGKRVMTIAGDDMIEAGTRCDGRFNYTNGSPIRDINMGRNKNEAYKNLVDAFNNKTIFKK